MQDTVIKQQLREQLQPLLDMLVDELYGYQVLILDKLPSSMSDEEKVNLIKPAMSAVVGDITALLSSVKPEDVAKKMEDMYARG